MWKSKEDAEQWQAKVAEIAKKKTEQLWEEAHKHVRTKSAGSLDQTSEAVLVAAYMQTRSTLLAMEHTTTFLESIEHAVKDVANR